MSIRKRFKRAFRRSRSYGVPARFRSNGKRRRSYRRSGKRATKIFGFSLPVIAVGAAAVWYFFLRKKTE